MQERLNDIFGVVIKEYIKTAKAVGSEFLAENFQFDLSSATLRNDLGELEALGFLTKHHNSSGRIPTDKGWRHYVDCLLDSEGLESPAKIHLVAIEKQLKELDDEPLMAGVAKIMAQMTHNVGIGAEPDISMFFTFGVSDFFREPEFTEPQDFQKAANLFDDIDDYFKTILRKLNDEPQIFIGRENSYNNAKNYSIIASCVSYHSEPRLVAILGPTRMNYRRNISVINAVSHLLKNL